MINIKYVQDEFGGKYLAEGTYSFRLGKSTLLELEKEIIETISREFSCAIEREFRNNPVKVADVHDYIDGLGN